MINKKKLRSDLFKHIDGIALTAPLSCVFNGNNSISNLLKKSNEFILDNNTLKSINADYLNVTLRLFESQGWLKRLLIKENVIKVKSTTLGANLFNQANLYNTFFLFFPYLIKLNFNNPESHKKLNEFLDRFDELEKKTQNKTIIKHIEGLILGPTLVALGMRNHIIIDSNNKLIFNNSINNENKKFILRLFKKFKLLNNEQLNEKGIFFYKRNAAYGVTVSYMPLFAEIDRLLFKDTSNILVRDKNGNELHVNRKMNVWGSGGAHKLYFKKIDEIIVEIFNKPIELQPKGIADMGCGDGTLLIHLYKLIKEKTTRGQRLKDYPLHIIGADFNDEALEVTGENLSTENINHILVKADIGNPNNFNAVLEKKHNIKLNDLLSVRSFLDHNRIFEMPNLDNFDLNKIKTNSTAAFSCNETNIIFEPIVFKIGLIEHFLKWKPFISKYGLILLELHTINPNICKDNIGKTLATAYDATHGYSNQYIIEYEDFIDSARLAGLKNNDNFEFNFPNKELTTVSINLFSV